MTRRNSGGMRSETNTSRTGPAQVLLDLDPEPLLVGIAAEAVTEDFVSVLLDPSRTGPRSPSAAARLATRPRRQRRSRASGRPPRGGSWCRRFLHLHQSGDRLLVDEQMIKRPPAAADFPIWNPHLPLHLQPAARRVRKPVAVRLNSLSALPRTAESAEPAPIALERLGWPGALSWPYPPIGSLDGNAAEGGRGA